MKKLLIALVATTSIAAPALAGNIEPAPLDPIIMDEPVVTSAGSSISPWLIGLGALLVIGGIIASDNDDS